MDNGAIVRRKYFQVLLHVLIWLTWFVAPLLFLPSDFQRSTLMVVRMWIPMVMFAILFYVNYFVLIDKLLFYRKFWAYFGINLLIIVVFMFFSELTKDLFRDNMLPPVKGMEGRPKPPQFVFYITHSFSFLFVISISIAIRTTGRWLKTENERKVLENENLRSELSNLRMQLNPHFFFNTLNNIYSLIQISPVKAQDAVHGLGKLMRYHLYDTDAERVPIGGEIDFLKSYISLMALRLGANVTLTTKFDIANPQQPIAPLLLIPIVENAFKHGVHPTDSCTISFTLSESNGLLRFCAENSNHPQSDQKSGIGIENLRKRLDLIYPQRHQFSTQVNSSMFYVDVEIDL